MFTNIINALPPMLSLCRSILLLRQNVFCSKWETIYLSKVVSIRWCVCFACVLQFYRSWRGVAFIPTRQTPHEADAIQIAFSSHVVRARSFERCEWWCKSIHAFMARCRMLWHMPKHARARAHWSAPVPIPVCCCIYVQTRSTNFRTASNRDT